MIPELSSHRLETRLEPRRLESQGAGALGSFGLGAHDRFEAGLCVRDGGLGVPRCPDVPVLLQGLELAAGVFRLPFSGFELDAREARALSLASQCLGAAQAR